MTPESQALAKPNTYPILVVDDDEDMVALIRLRLKKLGMKCLIAEENEKADLLTKPKEQRHAHKFRYKQRFGPHPDSRRLKVNKVPRPHIDKKPSKGNSKTSELSS